VADLAGGEHFAAVVTRCKARDGEERMTARRNAPKKT
jgi:hypothetical protein